MWAQGRRSSILLFGGTVDDPGEHVGEVAERLDVFTLRVYADRRTMPSACPVMAV